MPRFVFFVRIRTALEIMFLPEGVLISAAGYSDPTGGEVDISQRVVMSVR